jgi:hypothetical protein
VGEGCQNRTTHYSGARASASPGSLSAYCFRGELFIRVAVSECTETPSSRRPRERVAVLHSCLSSLSPLNPCQPEAMASILMQRLQ